MFLDLVTRVDNSPYESLEALKFRRFESHDGVLLGKITEPVVQHLSPVKWLSVTDTTVKITDPTNLDAKFAALTADWRQQATFSCLSGWRNELYTCYTTGGVRYFDIERSAAALFGIVTYGCHITGFDPSTNRIWVPRRSYNKPTYPGMLDNTVAGGLGNGVGFWQCAVKECGEEAGLDPEYVNQHLQQAGVITYEFLDLDTGYFQPEVECVYDLVMGSDVRPVPADGEVHEFKLMTYDEAVKHMLDGEFKYNSAVVLIDFFIRHGMITAESEPDLLEIASRSHRRLPYPLRRA